MEDFRTSVFSSISLIKILPVKSLILSFEREFAFAKETFKKSLLGFGNTLIP